MDSTRTTFKQRLFQPVDAASLAVFRIAFGITLFVESLRYLLSESNWIYRYYIQPEFHFKYYGFEWIEPLPGQGMYILFIVFGILSLMFAVGIFYKIVAWILVFLFSYIFLLDQAQYLNHFYFVILLLILMAILPVDRLWSIDAYRKPKLRSDSIPYWALLAFLIQMEIILIYAGVVKINSDWLIYHEPLRHWLAKRENLPILGPILVQEWAVAAACYGVIILHVLGAPLLFFRKTRLFVFCCYTIFHSLNSIIFTIGIFPWMTVFGTLIFFDPHWPRTLLAKIATRWQGLKNTLSPDPVVLSAWPPRPIHTVSVVVLVVFFTYQTLFPLRHYLYPGDVAWTEEGHRFSWRMKLRSKQGSGVFLVTNPVTNQTWRVRPKQYLTARQARKMMTRPDMILQFAHYLRDTWAIQKNMDKVEVRAQIYNELNYRKKALLIDPKRDLAKVTRELWPPADWILPLEIALNEPGR